MAADPRAVTPSSDAVIQTLKWIRKQGFNPVAIRKHSKAATDEKYVALDYSPPSDDMWMARDLGVGVVTGPKHKGPVDIDLDCDEAIFFAPLFLPPTPAVFGRKSKPASHRLYRVEVDAFPKKALVDPLTKEGKTIIEMRGDGGHQTVFPGSVHETTGEVIQWTDVAFPDVPRCDPELLEKAVKKVAMATLVTRHMWMEGQRNEVVKHLAGVFYYLDWTEDETSSFISAIMAYTGDKDKTRLRTVAITYDKGEKGQKVTGANSLRTLLGDPRLVDKILEWAGSHVSTIIQDYNERFAVVTIEGKFRIAETSGLEQGEPPTLFAKDDFMNMMATDTVVIDNKPVPKSKIWLANPRRRAYKAMDFIPGVEDTSPVLNLWTGWSLTPSPEKSCTAWKDLLYYTICGADDDTYRWMTNWFANIVREPASKPMTAPVVIGPQGAGKSLLLSYFGKILGPSYIVVTNEEHIYGRFNRHLATALLLHSEEALYGGDRKHKGIIKSLITDEWRIFEQKGVDAKRVHNYLRLVLTSNDSWAAPTEAGDRRFTVIDMERRKASDDLVKAVLVEMKDGGPAALFHDLLAMDYDNMLPRKNLKNEALSTLQQINHDPITSWWHECLRSGVMLPDFLWWACRPEREEWPTMVSSTALYYSMCYRMQGRGRYVPNQSEWAVHMNKMLGMKIERAQKLFSNPMSDDAPREVKLMSARHSTILNMPSLAECRTAFEHYQGGRLSWNEDIRDDDRPAHEQF